MNSRHATLLPSLPCPPRPTARDLGRPYHGGSHFVGAGDFRRIDRNERFRIWTAAQALDRRTHTKGRHGGVLGHSGLAVLRCLLFDFLSIDTGRLDPSYARDTVIEAMKRLVIAGIVEKTTRMIRERVKQWCDMVRTVIWMTRVRQTSNAYRLNFSVADRQAYGDLGAPLLKPLFSRVRAESDSQTETTPVSISSKLEQIADPDLRAILTRMGTRLGHE